MAEKVKAIEKTSKPEALTPARAQQRQPPPPADFALQSVYGDLAVPQAAGNLAMQRLLHTGAIQAKLSVSQPGDAHEQEADRIAEQVISSQPVRTIQRKCNTCASGAPCQECEGEHAIQRKAEPGQRPQADSKSSSPIIPLRSGGQPLSSSARAFFEPRFGYDFSGVRVHNYPQADAANHQLGARAFTYGRDIAFAAGQYSPDTAAGKKLLAHELTHVIQQAGYVDEREPTVSQPSDYDEREAGHVSREVMQGKQPVALKGIDVGLVARRSDGEGKQPVQMKAENARILRQAEEEDGDIPPLWDEVHSGYWKLVIDIGMLNLKLPTVTRQRLIGELTTAIQLGEPGEQTDAQLRGLLNVLHAFEKKVQKLNDEAQLKWGDLIERYQKEEKRLQVLVDEPESVKALEILGKEFSATMQRVDTAGELLVDEDLIQLKYMLDTDKHLELGDLYVSRNQDRGREVRTDEEGGVGPAVSATGHVSVYAGETMTSEAALREVYQKAAREISEKALQDVAKGVSVERAARWANQARNDLKVVIRSRGSSIVRGLAEARNVRKYGNKIGPAYEQLIRQGKTPADIIGSSGRASTKVNSLTSKLKVGGRLLIALDLAIVTWEVFSAPEGERLRTAVAGAAGIGGAAAGGWAGAKVGGAIGTFFGGPVGTTIGGIIGGIGGALLGGFFGHKAGEEVYDFFDELINPSEWDEYSDGIDEAETEYIQTHAQALTAEESQP